MWWWRWNGLFSQSNLAGTGESGTYPGSNSTIYEADDPSSESGNGGLNNLGQAVMSAIYILDLEVQEVVLTQVIVHLVWKLQMEVMDAEVVERLVE